MNNARNKTDPHRTGRSGSRTSAAFRDLAAQLGEFPNGLLAGDPAAVPSDASYRVARGLLGGVGDSGVSLSRDRTRKVASLLERLQDADRKHDT